MNTTTTSAQLEADTAKLLDDVEQIADDVRVRIHLAGMDIKDEWNKIEPHVLGARSRLTDASDASKKGLEELQKSLRKIRDSMA